MPRLGSLVVCEKTIQDQFGKPTLISLFQKINSLVPEGQELPKGATAAIHWSVYSEWFFTEEELTKNWEQVIDVLLPDGSSSSIKGRLPMKQLAPFGQGSRCFVNMVGMPVSQVGYVMVNIWLEINSEKMTDVFYYPIVIDYVQQAPAINDGGSVIMTVVPKP